MRDFQGIELNDDDTRDALINFSFYLTVGNMDEAYKVNCCFYFFLLCVTSLAD